MTQPLYKRPGPELEKRDPVKPVECEEKKYLKNELYRVEEEEDVSRSHSGVDLSSICEKWNGRGGSGRFEEDPPFYVLDKWREITE